MKYLGIDYGSKRVGLALSDDGATLAFLYDILPNNPDLVYEIASIINKEKIEVVVVGESTDFAGKENKIMVSIKKFVNELEDETGVKVVMQKEFLTSAFSRMNSGKSGNNARQTKTAISGPIDSSAAALILQRYLDKVNTSINKN